MEIRIGAKSGPMCQCVRTHAPKPSNVDSYHLIACERTDDNLLIGDFFSII